MNFYLVLVLEMLGLEYKLMDQNYSKKTINPNMIFKVGAVMKQKNELVLLMRKIHEL